MRIFSYRNKRRLRRIGLGVLVAALVLAIVCTVYVIYLGRFMVYTADGAHLALPGTQDDTQPDTSGQVPDGSFVVGDRVERPESTLPDIAEPDTGTESEPVDTLAVGYAISTTDLRSITQTQTLVDAALASIEDGSVLTVLIDLKSEFGNFYYRASVSDTPEASADLDAVEALLRSLSARDDVHLIARLPAFRDSAYALAHTDRALALSSGALWADGDGCYWLDPASDAVLDRLLALCTELASLGIDEVMFSDFYFPDGDSIVYDGSRDTAIVTAAERLAGGSPIPVSFSYSGDEPSFPGASFAQHICLPVEDGGDIAAALALFPDELAEDASRFIFLSDSRDTRFARYLQLRPISEE